MEHKYAKYWIGIDFTGFYSKVGGDHKVAKKVKEHKDKIKKEKKKKNK